MSRHTVRQASAFGFAAVVTLVMLFGVNGLALQPHADAALASAATPAAAQVVVVTGQRAPRS